MPDFQGISRGTTLDLQRAQKFRVLEQELSIVSYDYSLFPPLADT
jgi:hypothetical protein